MHFTAKYGILYEARFKSFTIFPLSQWSTVYLFIHLAECTFICKLCLGIITLWRWWVHSQMVFVCCFQRHFRTSFAARKKANKYIFYIFTIYFGNWRLANSIINCGYVDFNFPLICQEKKGIKWLLPPRPGSYFLASQWFRQSQCPRSSR